MREREREKHSRLKQLSAIGKKIILTGLALGCFISGGHHTVCGNPPNSLSFSLSSCLYSISARGGAEAAAAASLPPPPPAEAAASGLNGGHNQASQPIERGYHQPPPCSEARALVEGAGGPPLRGEGGRGGGRSFASADVTAIHGIQNAGG